MTHLMRAAGLIKHLGDSVVLGVLDTAPSAGQVLATLRSNALRTTTSVLGGAA